MRRPRASTLLLQCPASFRPEPDDVERLRHFIAHIAKPQCPPGLRLAWEPRGRAWTAHAQLALEICEELELVYVVDPFVDAIRLTAGPAYLRLHGSQALQCAARSAGAAERDEVSSTPRDRVPKLARRGASSPLENMRHARGEQ